jgi:hypothetical protein
VAAPGFDPSARIYTPKDKEREVENKEMQEKGKCV